MDEKNSIKFNSVTQALHAQEILAGYGIRSRIVRTSKLKSDMGCGYSLYINGNKSKSIEVIRSSGIRIVGE